MPEIDWDNVRELMNQNSGLLVASAAMLAVLIQVLCAVFRRGPMTPEQLTAALKQVPGTTTAGVTIPAALPDQNPAEKIKQKVKEAIAFGVQGWTNSKQDGKRMYWRCVRPGYTAITISHSPSGCDTLTIGEEVLTNLIDSDMLAAITDLDKAKRDSLEQMRLELALAQVDGTAPLSTTADQPNELGFRLYEAFVKAVRAKTQWAMHATDPSVMVYTPTHGTCNNPALSFRHYNTGRIDVYVNNITCSQLLTREQIVALAGMVTPWLSTDAAYGGKFRELVATAERYAAASNA